MIKTTLTLFQKGCCKGCKGFQSCCKLLPNNSPSAFPSTQTQPFSRHKFPSKDLKLCYIEHTNCKQAAAASASATATAAAAVSTDPAEAAADAALAASQVSAPLWSLDHIFVYSAVYGS